MQYRRKMDWECDSFGQRAVGYVVNGECVAFYRRGEMNRLGLMLLAIGLGMGLGIGLSGAHAEERATTRKSVDKVERSAEVQKEKDEKIGRLLAVARKLRAEKLAEDGWFERAEWKLQGAEKSVPEVKVDWSGVEKRAKELEWVVETCRDLMDESAASDMKAAAGAQMVLKGLSGKSFALLLRAQAMTARLAHMHYSEGHMQNPRDLLTDLDQLIADLSDAQNPVYSAKESEKAAVWLLFGPTGVLELSVGVRIFMSQEKVDEAAYDQMVVDVDGQLAKILAATPAKVQKEISERHRAGFQEYCNERKEGYIASAVEGVKVCEVYGKVLALYQAGKLEEAKAYLREKPERKAEMLEKLFGTAEEKDQIEVKGFWPLSQFGEKGEEGYRVGGVLMTLNKRTGDWAGRKGWYDVGKGTLRLRD